MSTTRKTRQLAMQHPVAVREDWETPAEVFGPLYREFGFTLDVCATRENAKCCDWFDAGEDGLAQDWSGRRCWMNPPYGAEIPKWIAKASAEADNGATVVCLVPARTDTRWWHDYVEGRAEVRFVKGRIRFVGARYNAPFPSAVVIFRGQTHERPTFADGASCVAPESIIAPSERGWGVTPMVENQTVADNDTPSDAERARGAA